MTEEGPPPPKRVKLSRGDLESMTKEEILEKWQEREAFVESLMAKHSNHVGEKDEEQEKVKQQQIEATRRENVLVMRLTTKEQEMQEYMNQIAELKQAQNTSTAQLRSMLLDPAINLMFQRMKKEMDACKEKLEQAQNDLAAWKFTPDSQTGKRLMAKCRMLLQENEELGKIISSGRTAKLEGEIALEKTLVAEMKKSRAEMDEFLIELDEDVEGMQSTIYFLQQQLKEAKEQLSRVQTENEQLKSKCSALAATTASPNAPSTPTINSSSSSSSAVGDSSPEPLATGLVGGSSLSSSRQSPSSLALPQQTTAVLTDDAKRTAPPTAAGSHGTPTPPGCGMRTQAGSPSELPGSSSSMPSVEGKAPSRQLVSNHSLSQNHASPTSNSAASAAATASSSAPGLVQPDESLSSSSLANNITGNSQPHHPQTSNSGATNGAHRPNAASSVDDDDDEMAAASTDLMARGGPSPNNNKQTGNSSSDVENDDDDDEVVSQSESPSQTPHYHHNHPHLQVHPYHQHPHHQQKEHKHGPPPAGGGRVPPSTTDGAPYGAENMDDHSSVGWSPSGSKHSGSVGGQVEDGDGSYSSPSEEADATSTDAKSSANELLQNGLQSGSRGGTPGYDSQGDDET